MIASQWSDPIRKHDHIVTFIVGCAIWEATKSELGVYRLPTERKRLVLDFFRPLAYETSYELERRLTFYPTDLAPKASPPRPRANSP
jgi:hypothetical protein